MSSLNKNAEIYQIISLNCLINECNEKFANEDALQDHLGVDHGFGPFICYLPACGESFISAWVKHFFESFWIIKKLYNLNVELLDCKMMQWVAFWILILSSSNSLCHVS